MSTFIKVVGNGVQTAYPIPFPYQSQNDVKVTVNGTPVSFEFADTATVLIEPAPADGSAVVIRRVTPSATPAVDFNDGNPRTGEDLDNAFKQSLYVATEATDMATEALLGRESMLAAVEDFEVGMTLLETAQADAAALAVMVTNERVLAEVANAEAETFKNQAETFKNQASTFANAAAASASSISGAEANALASAGVASGYADSAALSAIESANQAAASSASAITAASHANTASGHKDTALTYRNEAQTARSQAQAAQLAAEAAAENAQAASANDGSVKASNSDTTVGTLMSKIQVAGTLTKSLLNAGGNEYVLLTGTGSEGGGGGASTADAVSFIPTGSLEATNVQAAIAELDSEKSPVGHTHAAQSALQTPYTPTGNISATNVQSAISELDSEKSPVGHTHAAQTAGNTPFTPAGNIASGNVQAALEELDSEKQSASGQLNAISGLSANGLIARTGTNSASARTITAGSSKVSVTNGDGVSGNPTLDVVEANLTLGNLGGVLPVAKGGTGGTTGAEARAALGITPTNIGALGASETAQDSTKWAGATRYVSTAAPSGGVDGDIWFEREA